MNAKTLVFQTLSFLRIPEISLHGGSDAPRIFLYHGVHPWVPGYGIFNYRKKFVTPELFRQELLWIKRQFSVIPLSHLIERSNHDSRIPPRAAAITFDDGYENNYQYAFPILKEYKLPATFFLATDLVDGVAPLWFDTLEFALGHAHAGALEVPFPSGIRRFPLATHAERTYADIIIRDAMKKMPGEERKKLLDHIIRATGKNLADSFRSSPYRGMTWEHAREMEEAGMASAPHTRTHPILSRISLSEAKEEILSSRTRLEEELAHPLHVFAYPNGQKEDITDDVVSLVKESGFRAALTTIPRPIRTGEDLYLTPRIAIDGTPHFSVFKNHASGVTHTLRRIRNPFK